MLLQTTAARPGGSTPGAVSGLSGRSLSSAWAEGVRPERKESGLSGRSLSSATACAPPSTISAPGRAGHTSCVDTSRLTSLEARLAQLDSKVDSSSVVVTSSRVERQQRSEVCCSMAKFGKSDRDDPGDFFSFAVGGGVQGELDDLRCQVAALQAAVDGDVLEAFRRLRQQTAEINAKVDEHIAGCQALSPATQAPRSPVFFSAENVVPPAAPQLPLVEVHALEARISAALMTRLDFLGEQVLASDERMSERLVNAEACLAELQADKPRATEEVDARITEIGQEILLLMEERFAAVEVQVLGGDTEQANSLKVVREELIEMSARIFQVLEERMVSQDSAFKKLQENHHEHRQDLVKLQGDHHEHRQMYHHFLHKHIDVNYGALGDDEEVPRGAAGMAHMPEHPHTDHYSHGEDLGRQPGLRHHDGQPAATGCGAIPATSASATAGMAALDALAALRGRLQEQTGECAIAAEGAAVAAAVAAAAAARSARMPCLEAGTSSDGGPEEAVVAAIAAARARGSPGSSHRSVASAFSALAGIDQDSNASTSPARFLHCSDIVDPDAWASSIREQGGLVAVGEGRAEEKFNEERIGGKAQYSPSDGYWGRVQSAEASPQVACRGRQLQGRPEVSDYKEPLVQDSPFRNKKTRDMLPRFGSTGYPTGLSKFLPTAVLRSLREEDGTESPSASRPASPPTASTGPAAAQRRLPDGGPANSEQRSLQRSGSTRKVAATTPPSSPPSASRVLKRPDSPVCATVVAGPHVTCGVQEPSDLNIRDSIRQDVERLRINCFVDTQQQVERLRRDSESPPKIKEKGAMRTRTPPRQVLVGVPTDPDKMTSPTRAKMPAEGTTRRGSPVPEKSAVLGRKSSPQRAKLAERDQQNPPPAGAMRRPLRGPGVAVEESPKLERWRRGARSPTETVTTHISD